MQKLPKLFQILRIVENYIFNHKKDLKSAIENNIWDLDVLKSIPHGQDEDRCPLNT